MKAFFIILISSFLGSLTAAAQGFQYAQIALNRHAQQAADPALTEGNAQLYLAYRSAWNGQTPFRNMLISYQHKIKSFSIGAKVLQQDAGTTSLKSGKVLLDLSYKKKLNEMGDFLALGVSGGLLQNRFKEQSFQFDNQYTEGLGFDATTASEEVLLSDNQAVAVFNVGLVARKQFNRLEAMVGLSLNQINKPSIGFYQESTAILYPETSIFTQVKLPWSERLQGIVYLAFLQSKISKEQIAALQIDYKCADQYWLRFGAASKLNEAFILSLGFRFYKTTLMFSYDLNHTMLADIQGFNGAFELSAQHDF